MKRTIIVFFQNEIDFFRCF